MLVISHPLLNQSRVKHCVFVLCQVDGGSARLLRVCVCVCFYKLTQQEQSLAPELMMTSSQDDRSHFFKIWFCPTCNSQADAQM